LRLACALVIHRFFFFSCSVRLPLLHSFPTRRSSDLPYPGCSQRFVQLRGGKRRRVGGESLGDRAAVAGVERKPGERSDIGAGRRSEEHTSELQSRFDLVCRLLLEKKKATKSSGRCKR